MPQPFSTAAPFPLAGSGRRAYASVMRMMNRREAGHRLGEKLRERRWSDPVVLALPRGGVPVGLEIARAMAAPLDVLIVRKVGAPGHPEYGIGAITEDGHCWMDPASAIRFTSHVADVQETVTRERIELERRIMIYRGGRPLPRLTGHSVIVADDGLATGVTARVACAFLRQQGAREVVLAVPVCAPDTAEIVRQEVDELLCLCEPDLFYSVGQFYDEFEQLSDREVLDILQHSGLERPLAG